MDTDFFKQLIEVVANETERRAALIDADAWESGSDSWLFRDEPFLRQMFLLVLVGLWQDVERHLLSLAVRARGQGKLLSRQEYEDGLKQVVSELRKDKKAGWKKIADDLGFTASEHHSCIEVLWRLANAFKHEPTQRPDHELLRLLKLSEDVVYGALPESDAVRERLAIAVQLPGDSDFRAIVDKFVSTAEMFLRQLESRPNLSCIERRPVSLRPRDFAH